MNRPCTTARWPLRKSPRSTTRAPPENALPPATATVTLQSSPAAGGSTSGAGTFLDGSVVTVTATPNAQGGLGFYGLD